MKKTVRRIAVAGTAALALAGLLATSGCGEVAEDLARQAGQAALDEINRTVEEEIGIGLDELGQLVGIDELVGEDEEGRSGYGSGSWDYEDEQGEAEESASLAGAGGFSGAGAGAAVASVVSDGLRHEVSTELTAATVERVVDGDTLKVILSDTGESQRVRLIGVNTPESVAPEDERNTAEGVDASDFLKDYLVEGQLVWLMFDTEVYDQYDRMLAYVWTELPSDFTDPAEVRAKMVNGYLAYEGYAVVHAYAPNDAYCDMLHDLADDAEWAGRGLWEISSTWADGI